MNGEIRQCVDRLKEAYMEALQVKDYKAMAAIALQIYEMERE